jgi:2',3'-cyclic-nucleotide 2'-phosphodiesterase (5'-nucleotidase family)
MGMMMQIRGVVAAVAILAILTIRCSFAIEDDNSFVLQDQMGDVVISVVGTNDLHGRMLARDAAGGLPLLAGYLRNLRLAREKDGGAVVLLDAGDIYHGTVESNLGEGREIIAAYNLLGYDAVAVGNHEYDFGPIGSAVISGSSGEDSRGAIKARAQEANFPFLAANLIEQASGGPVSWRNVQSSVLIVKSRVKIGIIGVSTIDTIQTTIAANMHGLDFLPLAETVLIESRKLRQEGASLVFLTAHAGGQCSDFSNPTDLTSCDLSSEIFALANKLSPDSVNVIVAGHIHEGIAHEVNGIPIISSYGEGRAFGRIDLKIRVDTGDIVSKRIYRPQYVCEFQSPASEPCQSETAEKLSRRIVEYEGQIVEKDRSISDVLVPAIDRARDQSEMQLGITLSTTIGVTNGRESPLGNLVTDAVFESIAGTDAVILNTTGGFVTASLKKGPQTYGMIFEVIPFENNAITLDLTGAEVKTVLKDDIQTNRKWLGVAGINVQATCENGSLNIELTRLSGETIADEDHLSVVTSEFLAAGGDSLLASIIPLGGFDFSYNSSPSIRELVISWLQQQPAILDEARFLDGLNSRELRYDLSAITCSRDQNISTKMK